MRVQIVEIPAKTAEDVLSRFQQEIEFPGTFITNPLDIPFHVPLSIASAKNWDLGFEELRQGFFPFVGARGMAEARVEEHKAIQIRVEWLEVLRIVHRMEVIDICGDLKLSAQSVLDDPAERVFRRTLRERKFGISIGHTLRSDEDKVNK